MKTKPILIDGSKGEGGGQVLRTSLALSLLTGKPIQVTNIRAGRKRPGLMRQHLTAVQAATEIGRARVEGDSLRSKSLYFEAQGVFPGNYRFAVGTAGSCTLVLQTVLPALLLADEPSKLVLEGGTHNPMAPPFDFLDDVYAHLVGRMGAELALNLVRPGFYPAGGGLFTAKIRPATDGLQPIELLERGETKKRLARVLSSRLPPSIAHRELKVVRDKLGFGRDELVAEEAESSRGPGNCLMVRIESEHGSELFTAFGQKGVRAETVARKVTDEVRAYLAADVPVGEHLADQLVLLLAIAGCGSFRSLAPSGHTRTQMELIPRFLPVQITAEQVAEQVWHYQVQPKP